MEEYICWQIAGHTLEYFDNEHLYLVDGITVPSVTQILKIKFGNKYSNVPEKILKKASEKGTEVHKAIEDYCKLGIETELKELKNFKFLQKQYNFKVVDNEIPIIIFESGIPVAVGRLDLELEENGEIGLGDIKRTSVLDKEYLAYQLNLYRIGFQQCYNTEIKFLKGLHLRENTRRYINIPINEELALELLKEYKERKLND